MSYASEKAEACKAILLRYLNAAKWNISQAARDADVNRQGFYTLMRRYGITRAMPNGRYGNRGQWGAMQ